MEKNVDMLEVLTKYLDDMNAFGGVLPPVLNEIIDSIPANIPKRMKKAISVSEMVLFASQFRRNIKHWNGSSIPVNSITFSIGESGKGKDSSKDAARKCFKPAYKMFEKTRKQLAREIAIRKAKSAGKENPMEWDSFREYYKTPPPLFIAPSTTEGFIQHMNDLDSAGSGSGFLYTGEFGAELESSGVMTDNIKTVSEMYDTGSKEVKVLKNRESQTKEIQGFPVNAMFMGSQDDILHDQHIRAKFKREATTKLARRSTFNFNPEAVPVPTFATGKEAIQYEIDLENTCMDKRASAQTQTTKVFEYHSKKVGVELGISTGVRELFTGYKRYNEEVATNISAKFPMSVISRNHLQWKALKLSGAIAMFNLHDSITVDDYKSAIVFVEALSGDLELFEAELVKEPYEMFVDYVHAGRDNGKFHAGLHTLRKLGYVPTTGASAGKLKELAHLAGSYDIGGVYSVDSGDTGISYEKIIRTDVTGVSYLEVEGTKDQRKKKCADGYEFYETNFHELGDMLLEDLAYTPFRLKDGVRGKDNILGGCKWITLDIDDSCITDEECHSQLSNINHHIARTSDNKNPFKFRVLVELDAIVDIPNEDWRRFISSISKDLGLTVDILPKSTIFFSYSTSTSVLSVVDAETVGVKPHIMKSLEDNKPNPSNQSAKSKAAELEDPLTTFQYAFECDTGCSVSLIRAARHAKDLGATTKEILKLVNEINDYWYAPMDAQRFADTIITQIERW